MAQIKKKALTKAGTKMAETLPYKGGVMKKTRKPISANTSGNTGMMKTATPRTASTSNGKMMMKRRKKIGE